MKPRQADDRQRQSVRDELHAAIDRIVDAWPALDRQSRDMGRGFPTQGDGPGGAGSHGDPVARLALEDRLDPAVLAGAWLAEFESWRQAARRLASKSVGLLPSTMSEPAKLSLVGGRRARCECCGDPAEAGEFKLGRWCASCYRRLLRREQAPGTRTAGQ